MSFTDKMKKDLLEKINKLDVNVSGLSSYKHDKNPFHCDWNDDEEWEYRVNHYIKIFELESERLQDYIPMSDEEILQDEDRKITFEALNWLYKII